MNERHAHSSPGAKAPLWSKDQALPAQGASPHTPDTLCVSVVFFFFKYFQAPQLEADTTVILTVCESKDNGQEAIERPPSTFLMLGRKSWECALKPEGDSSPAQPHHLGLALYTQRRPLVPRAWPHRPWQVGKGSGFRPLILALPPNAL